MRIFVLAGVLSALATPTWSDVIPAGTTVASCQFGGTIVTDPSACSFGGGSASATLSPFVGLQAASSGFGQSNGAIAQAKYSFEVVGGNPGDVVPVDILVGLRTAASVNGIDDMGGGIAGGFADINVLNHGQSIVEKCASTDRINRDLCGVDHFSGSLATTAVSGDLSNQLQLRVSADTGSDPFGDSLSAFAFADPLIIVDPNFPGADKYSIVLSPGVGNGIASTVPEPVTLVPLGAILALFPLLGLRPGKSLPRSRS